MKKYSLLIVYILIVLCACNYRKNASFPNEFECFEFKSPYFFVKYTQPVEGYTLKAMFFPKHKYSNISTVFMLNIDNGEKNFNQMIDGNNIIVSDIEHLTNKNITDINDGEIIILDQQPPIYFYDVDFDNEKEFIIANTGGWCGGIFYEIYKMNYNSLDKMNEYPFEDLGPNTQFDTINKTITNTFSFANSWYTYIYKQKEYQYMTVEYDSFTKKCIELDSVYIDRGDATPVRIHEAYKRKGNKMEIVQRVIVNFDKDFDISENHLEGIFTDTIIADKNDVLLQKNN